MFVCPSQVHIKCMCIPCAHRVRTTSDRFPSRSATILLDSSFVVAVVGLALPGNAPSSCTSLDAWPCNPPTRWSTCFADSKPLLVAVRFRPLRSRCRRCHASAATRTTSTPTTTASKDSNHPPASGVGPDKGVGRRGGDRGGYCMTAAAAGSTRGGGRRG